MKYTVIGMLCLALALLAGCGSPVSPPTDGAPALTATLPSGPTPTITLTPTNSIIEATKPTVPTTTAVPGIVEVSDRDVEILTRLLVIEVRGMAEERQSAGASILSTVFLRMKTRTDSDGGVEGTIGYGCTRDSETCAFPAFVLLDDCAGIIVAACYRQYPNEMTFFRQVVYQFLYGYTGECPNRLYYDSRAIRDGDCVIQASNGFYERFHD